MEIFLLFMLYSFFGCVLEDAYHFALCRKYVSKRTMLNLPLCPVYGIAALVMGRINFGVKNIFLLYFGGFFAISAVELAYYLLSRRLYGIKWWDYSEMKVNIMGGVSLFYSSAWGFLNILFAYFIDPACRAWIDGFPESFKYLTGLFLAAYFIADAKATHNELKKYKNSEENRILSRFAYIKSNN